MCCSSCGLESQVSDLFCARCGARLRAGEQSESTVASATSTAAPSQQRAISASAISAPAPPVERQVLELAGAWPRYWARMLDVLLWCAVCAILLGFFAPSLFNVLVGLPEQSNNQLLGLFILPIAMLADALCYGVFAATPGKWLCGIRVEDLDAQRIPFTIYLRRNFGVYFYGLAMGIGIVALFTLARNYNKVKSGRLTSWDENTTLRVNRAHGGALRTTVTAVLYFAVFFGLVAVGEVYGNKTPEQQLEEAAALANKGSPKMVDEATRLDSISTAPGRVVQYNYTLIGVSGNEVELAAVNLELQANVRPRVVSNFCKSADMKFVRDRDGSVRHRYLDKNGELVATFEASKSDCKTSM